MTTEKVSVRFLGTQPYQETLDKMRAFTNERTRDAVDEFWIVQHPPVFTQGQAGKAEHILRTSDIPLVQSDRGGQVTYHGPGQLVIYLLIDIRRKKYGVRALVDAIEKSIVNVLKQYDIDAYAKPEAPGVYVDAAKIASLGLRIRKGCSFHGLALNVNMDLSPFNLINPCGYAGLKVTQCADLHGPKNVDEAASALITYLAEYIGYTSTQFIT